MSANPRVPNLRLVRPPSIDSLLRDPRLAELAPRARKLAARDAVDEARRRIAAGEELTREDVVGAIVSRAEALPSLRPVINMSGVVLNTGLGRARLAAEAVEAVLACARDHVSLEVDLGSGGRGDRQSHVSGLLRELTGCEDALVVNNCAAAVHLSLAALCRDRSVLLSRGQMVEIGGGFRMPEIVRDSGARLIEVGCTNKTRLSDYTDGWTDETAAILRCHPSNFRIVGFHDEPSAHELAATAHESGGLLIDDVGSGCLIDTSRFGIGRERTLRDALSDGADVVTASGDKLLGGPQCGLVLGTSATIARLRSHPLARAMRVDKLTLAALEATLRLYAEGRELEVPIWAAVGRPPESVRRVANRLRRACPRPCVVESGTTEIGGGSMPGAGVATWRLGILGPGPLVTAARLRQGRVPIIGYVANDVLWLDPRTVTEAEVLTVASELQRL